MSDQALAWKAAFGGLVLLYCAGTYIARHSQDAPRAAAPPVAASASLPARPVEPLPQEAPDDAPPVRIQVTLLEPEPPAAPQVGPPMRAQVRVPARSVRPAKTPAPRIHMVAAHRKPSPYRIGRKHYPYDPHERWAFREAP